MALVRCPDCGRDVSDRAPACIHCGRPNFPPATAEPSEVCVVILRRISGLSGLGLLTGAHWILEGQMMTPQGILVVASSEYTSGNDLANFQSSDREFHKARESITNELLRAGWQPVASVSGGDALSLPRFQRRARGETQQLLRQRSSATKRYNSNKKLGLVVGTVLTVLELGVLATAGIIAAGVFYVVVVMPVFGVALWVRRR